MNFETILQKIIEKTNLSAEDIQKKILEKQHELSGLVSKEGAAYIIAKEMGIDVLEIRKGKLEIRNIVSDIKNLSFKARILRIFDTREFEKEGRKIRVANVILGDGTGTVRMSFWDNQIEILRGLDIGKAVEIFGAYTKSDRRGGVEVRLGKRSGIKLISDSDLPAIDKMPEQKIERATIADLKENGSYELKAAIVQLFDINPLFEVCSVCGLRVKKDNNEFRCPKHGAVQPQYSMVISGIIDDGTENIRAVFFRDNALKLTGMDINKVLENKNNFLDNLDILGKEFILNGTVRKNKMFGKLEFLVSDVKEVEAKEEINKILNTFGSNV